MSDKEDKGRATRGRYRASDGVTVRVKEKKKERRDARLEFASFIDERRRDGRQREIGQHSVWVCVCCVLWGLCVRMDERERKRK